MLHIASRHPHQYVASGGRNIAYCQINTRLLYRSFTVGAIHTAPALGPAGNGAVAIDYRTQKVEVVLAENGHSAVQLGQLLVARLAVAVQTLLCQTAAGGLRHIRRSAVVVKQPQLVEQQQVDILLGGFVAVPRHQLPLQLDLATGRHIGYGQMHHQVVHRRRGVEAHILRCGAEVGNLRVGHLAQGHRIHQRRVDVAEENVAQRAVHGREIWQNGAEARKAAVRRILLILQRRPLHIPGGGNQLAAHRLAGLSGAGAGHGSRAQTVGRIEGVGVTLVVNHFLDAGVGIGATFLALLGKQRTACQHGNQKEREYRFHGAKYYST